MLERVKEIGIVPVVVLNKVESLTYEYYYNNIRPKNKQTSGSKVGWRCVVCGYIYEGEDIPEDYICPLCKADDRFHFPKPNNVFSQTL